MLPCSLLSQPQWAQSHLHTRRLMNANRLLLSPSLKSRCLGARQPNLQKNGKWPWFVLMSSAVLCCAYPRKYCPAHRHPCISSRGRSCSIELQLQPRGSLSQDTHGRANYLPTLTSSCMASSTASSTCVEESASSTGGLLG